MLLYVLSSLAPLLDQGYGDRLAALLLAILAARGGVQIVCPLVAIAFKWLVIGRYKVGTYGMYVLSFQVILLFDIYRGR